MLLLLNFIEDIFFYKEILYFKSEIKKYNNIWGILIILKKCVWRISRRCRNLKLWV